MDLSDYNFERISNDLGSLIQYPKITNDLSTMNFRLYAKITEIKGIKLYPVNNDLNIEFIVLINYDLSDYDPTKFNFKLDDNGIARFVVDYYVKAQRVGEIRDLEYTRLDKDTSKELIKYIEKNIEFDWRSIDEE